MAYDIACGRLQFPSSLAVAAVDCLVRLGRLTRPPPSSVPAARGPSGEAHGYSTTRHNQNKVYQPCSSAALQCGSSCLSIKSSMAFSSVASALHRRSAAAMLLQQRGRASSEHSLSCLINIGRRRVGCLAVVTVSWTNHMLCHSKITSDAACRLEAAGGIQVHDHGLWMGIRKALMYGSLGGAVVHHTKGLRQAAAWPLIQYSCPKDFDTSADSVCNDMRIHRLCCTGAEGVQGVCCATGHHKACLGR